MRAGDGQSERAGDGQSERVAPASSPSGDSGPAGHVDPDDLADVDADAPISARSWSDAQQLEPVLAPSPAGTVVGPAVGPAVDVDGAPTAEQQLRARVLGAAVPSPPAERAPLTPATLVALLLLVVSAGASLTYVLVRGGASLPSARPSVPLAAIASGASSPTPTLVPASPSPAPSVAFVQPSILALLPSAVPPTQPSTVPPTQPPAATVQPDRRYAEDGLDIVYSGTWARATSSAYIGGAVAWTTSAGASATLSFAGRVITWYGPVGPTRGSAAVYLDGTLAATVSQHADSFSARRAVFSHTFGSAGSHTIRIVASGTPGHPMVAIDELVAAF